MSGATTAALTPFLMAALMKGIGLEMSEANRIMINNTLRLTHRVIVKDIEAKARTSGLYFSGSVIKCQSHSPRLTGVFASFTHYLIRLLRMNKVQSTYRSDLLFYIVYMDSSSYMSKVSLTRPMNFNVL
ncbi:hypothetical protein SeMB42_g04439 [Synchytrium endobioticum]|uniref:Uncharacterized protein n=1 Tax=Synchytrium endobioticum TaxID=286115 RepID=A0A507CYH5_9FUNG|nr:hypothetical protein SeMB42_g04439 [Synchytrium endobioticum]